MAKSMEKAKPESGKDAQRKPGATTKGISKASLHPAANSREKKADNGSAGPKQNTHSALGAVVKTAGITLSTDTFIDLVNQGIECWREAGALLVTWKKQEPSCFQLILNRAPWLSIATLEMFERIGNRQMHPKILLLPPAQAERATRLSYDEQESLCSGSLADASKKLKAHPKPRDYTPIGIKKLSDKLPTVGFFEIRFAARETTIREVTFSSKAESAIPIVLDRDYTCTVQLLKP